MQSTTKLRIILTTLNGLAQITTLTRLVFRSRRRRFWVDDVFAAVAAISSLAALVAWWIISDSDVEGTGPFGRSHTIRLRAYWVYSVSIIWSIWPAKTSILLSLCRLLTTPVQSKWRPWVFGAASFAGSLGASLFAQRVYLCTRNREWEGVDHEPVRCRLRTMTITQVSFESASSMLLIVFPLILLLKSEYASKIQRTLFITHLTGNILVAASSVAACVYLILPPDKASWYGDLTLGVQMATTLLVTNLPLLLIYLSRHTYPEIENEYDDPRLERGVPHGKVSALRLHRSGNGNGNLKEKIVVTKDGLGSLSFTSAIMAMDFGADGYGYGYERRNLKSVPIPPFPSPVDSPLGSAGAASGATKPAYDYAQETIPSDQDVDVDGASSHFTHTRNYNGPGPVIVTVPPTLPQPSHEGTHDHTAAGSSTDVSASASEFPSQGIYTVPPKNVRFDSQVLPIPLETIRESTSVYSTDSAYSMDGVSDGLVGHGAATAPVHVHPLMDPDADGKESPLRRPHVLVNVSVLPPGSPRTVAESPRPF